MAIQLQKHSYDLLESLKLHQQTAKLPSQPYAKVGLKDTSLANAGNRIWSAFKTFGKTTAETIGIGIDASVNKILLLTSLGIVGLIGQSGNLAYQHGMKCATFSAARNIIFEKPSILTKTLWADRDWPDYLPFIGAFEAQSFSDLLSVKTSILPKVIQVFLNTAGNVHEIKKFMNTKDMEPIVTKYLEATGKLPSLTGKTVFEKAINYADSIAHDFSAAECSDFEGYANATATLVTALGSILILTACYTCVKHHINNAYKKCTG